MTLGDSPPAASASRPPIERIGATVLKGLVETIVSNEVAPGDSLPNEASLTQEFGVSRTVIRESVKRLQEKGMVSVIQGRGTHVRPMSSWNLLDPLVLSVIIGHDDALGILDDLSVVRGTLEAVMAGTVAASHSEEELERLRVALDEMRESLADSAGFREADVRFHRLVMELSGNVLAGNIANVLFERALESTRYHGADPEHAFEMTLAEHERVFESIAAGDRDAARRSMEDHILGSWGRRRIPTSRERGTNERTRQDR